MKTLFWTVLLGLLFSVSACRTDDLPPTHDLDAVLGEYSSITKSGATEYIILLILVSGNANTPPSVDVVIQHKKQEYKVSGQLLNNHTQLRIAPQVVDGQRFEANLNLSNNTISGVLYHNGQPNRIQLLRS